MGQGGSRFPQQHGTTAPAPPRAQYGSIGHLSAGLAGRGLLWNAGGRAGGRSKRSALLSDRSTLTLPPAALAARHLPWARTLRRLVGCALNGGAAERG